MSIDRATGNDVVQLGADRGSVPANIGVLLVFDPVTAPRIGHLTDVLDARVRRVPRLVRRLVATPWGCGRPVWVADPGFRLGRHLDVAGGQGTVDDRGDPAGPERPECPECPGGPLCREAAMGLILQRLPRDRPLWRARAYTDERGRVSVLVLVMHHALADGVSGLAVLRALADHPGQDDGLPAVASTTASASAPASAMTLARDAWAGRARALARAPHTWRRAAAGVRELGLGHPSSTRPRMAERGSLLTPTSPHRRADVIDLDLGAVNRAARAAGVTLNDLILLAVSGALGALLRERGEHLESVVVSVPVSSRATTSAGHLGNEVGALLVSVPLAGDPANRLRAITAQTSLLGRTSARGGSAGLLAPAFRLLAVTGLFQWFTRHQRFVHTFETNLRGPDAALSVAGGLVSQIVPVAVTPGNVTVSFGVLSYAGRLVVSVVSDPDHVPEHALVAAVLRRELEALCDVTVAAGGLDSVLAGCCSRDVRGLR